ncbi:MAG: P44/Msp2 family outer membrane protein [Anaplasma sp.]
MEFCLQTGSSPFVIGLDYVPTFSGIRDFKIGEAGGETKMIVPYRRNIGGRVSPVSPNFDWEAPEPKISFKDSKLMALWADIIPVLTRWGLLVQKK